MLHAVTLQTLNARQLIDLSCNETGDFEEDHKRSFTGTELLGYTTLSTLLLCLFVHHYDSLCILRRALFDSNCV